VVLSTASVPLFLWTDKSYFSSPHQDLVQPLLLEDIEYTFSHSLKSLGTPEIIVAFVAKQLASNEISQMGSAFGANTKDQIQHLKAALSSARNSLTVPYLYTSQKQISQSLIQSLKTSSPQGTIIQGNFATETCDNVLAKLESFKSVFSNEITDLLLISFSDYEAQQVDTCLQRVNTFVQNHVNQNYIALLSADQSPVEPQLIFSNEKLENDILTEYSLFAQKTPVNLFTSRKLLQTNTNTTTPVFVGPQFISSAILFGILLGFALLFFLWQGIYQITLIEPPVRFSHNRLQLSREY